MIGFIQGKIIHQAASYVTILTSAGVGYKVHVPFKEREKNEVKFFIHHHIREDTNDLYGFESSEDLLVFELLLSVSGVGPKAALSLVSALGRDSILRAIADGDVSVFKSISGIGNKVAAKIIVELKGKVVAGAGSGILIPEDDETVEALVGLGYKKSEVLPYLAKIPKDVKSVQDKVKYVLKSAGKKS
jgi:Holliday junction DNA helicase RuvA